MVNPIQHYKRWQNVLMASVCAFLIIIFLTAPVLNWSIVDISVADGNGTLRLGTLGYCLYLQPNRECKYLFSKIGQFFLQP